MSLRGEQVAKLRGQAFDLLIIGGGIVGAGIARDAAMRGLRVALVEKGDFAGGTSSKTSKLIHGGLRYLEHGRLRLVFESLRERDALRTIAPQMVWPLSLTIPIYRGDPRSLLMVRCGLMLYDWLALNRRRRSHRVLTPRQTAELEPRLRREGLRAAPQYTDCQMDDARLCLANVLQAVSFGAACANYVKLLALNKTHGAISGATVEDGPTGRTFEIRAAVVVNATGPWSDAVRRMSDLHAGTRMAPTKGIHLVVPRLTTHGVFFQARQDARMIFLLPWGDYSLVGTTESTEIASLDALHATDDDAAYLLQEVNALIPDARLTPADLVATFAGARPLLAFSGSATRASREHQLEIDPFGLVSIMGGKYTTYRVMAQQTVDAVIARFQLRGERCLTDQVSLLEPAHPMLLHRWQDLTRRISEELLSRLLVTYGTGAFRILELIEFEPALAQPVCPHHQVIQAEFAYAIREEMACTISDLLVRRTTIAYSNCQGLDLLSTLTDVLQRYARLPHEQVMDQAERYHRLLADSLSMRHAALRSAGTPVHASVS